MDHYLDIRVRPDPEFSPSMLICALFGKLHRALVSLNANDIGISLPEHQTKKRSPGMVLRLHGGVQSLGRLMAAPWLQGMRDHVDVASVSPVPADARYRVVRRRQFKTNAERLRRRRAKRHDETLDQARQHIPDTVERRVPLPYLTLRSHSTKQAFSLFIEHGPLTDVPVAGTFSSYGLSTTATVPWF